MPGEEQRAAPAAEGRVEVLAAIHPDQLLEGRGGRVPGERDLDEPEPERLEMAIEEGGALVGAEIGEAVREVRGRNRAPAGGDPPPRRAEEARGSRPPAGRTPGEEPQQPDEGPVLRGAAQPRPESAPGPVPGRAGAHGRRRPAAGCLVPDSFHDQRASPLAISRMASQAAST